MVRPAEGAARGLVRLLGRPPARLRRWATDTFYAALALLLAPYAVLRLLRESKTRARWRAYARDLPERFGGRVRRAGTRPCLWVHGVSVGEVKAAGRLIERIQDERPDLDVVVTVSTDTARRVAHARYPRLRVDFYPPDLSFVVRRALDAIRPDLVVLVESEFWPNFLGLARERGLPVVLVNGRMSPRSARRFQRAGALGRSMLDSLALLCVQLEAYAERFRSVGVPEARIRVTGNMKLDNLPAEAAGDRAGALERRIGRTADRPLLVAGSTHPGEERALAGIVARLAASGRPVRLLVAPRHPARSDGIEAQLRRDGSSVVRWTRLDGRTAPSPEAVVLLDTVGELEAAYALADLVFVGGTLVRHGGQNVMEPASAGRPVVVGPYVHNFRGEVDLLRQAQGIAVVEDEAGVEATLRAWIERPEAARETGRRAREAVLAGRGATERTLAAIRPLLPRPRSGPTDLDDQT